MTKIRILTISVAVLIVLNLVLVGFLIKGHPTARKHPGPKKKISEALHFNAEQEAAYDILIHQHQQQVQRLDSLILESKQHLYDQTLTVDSSAIHTHLDHIGQLVKQLEYVHLEHFMAIKELCTDEQAPYFEHLVSELAAFFDQANRPPHRK